MQQFEFSKCFVNGEKAGKVLIDAAILAEKGKPVIMVSGDDKVCAEAKAIISGIVTAEVKKATGYRGHVSFAK
ncbi:MAG: M55 family metallopeptidase [Clostridia bacterium]|nr:M55 family metallopeptidase [Clostridia bacterium]